MNLKTILSFFREHKKLRKRDALPLITEPDYNWVLDYDEKQNVLHIYFDDQSLKRFEEDYVVDEGFYEHFVHSWPSF